MKSKDIDKLSYSAPDRTSTEATRLSDPRRPRLTLRHLNKLRKIRELRRLEKAQREKEVQDIYGKNRDSSDDSKPTMIPRKTH